MIQLSSYLSYEIAVSVCILSGAQVIFQFFYWNLFIDKPQPRYPYLIDLMPCILVIFMKLPINCQTAKNKIIKTMISKQPGQYYKNAPGH